MKIAHVIDSGGLYGAEIMLLSLVKQQLSQGISPKVFSIGTPGEYVKPLERELSAAGIEFFPVRMKAGINLSGALHLLRLLKLQGVDVIHSHGYKSNILLGLMPSFFRKIPVITTLHGYTKYPLFSKMTFNQILDKLSLRFISRVVFVSPATNICRFGLGSKTDIIFNGIDKVDSNNNQDVIAGDLNRGLVIGSVGRLCHEKNFQFLIHAMPNVLQCFPSAKLIIHGEGQLRNELEALIDQLSLRDHVFLPGYVSNVDLFMKSVSVYVNCSVTEGMPMTILEAMRAKTLVLVSDIPANRFLIGGIHDSAIFELNERDFILRLQRICEMADDDRNKLRVKYHDNYVEKYTASKMAEQYFAVYKRVLNG